MLKQILILHLISLLGLSACSHNEKPFEDSIQAIQNAQFMRDGKTARPARSAADDERILVKRARTAVVTEVAETEFQVDAADGKIMFKAEVVYYDSDEAVLTVVGMHQVKLLGEYMRSHPETQLKIEGYDDSRG